METPLLAVPMVVDVALILVIEVVDVVHRIVNFVGPMAITQAHVQIWHHMPAEVLLPMQIWLKPFMPNVMSLMTHLTGMLIQVQQPT